MIILILAVLFIPIFNSYQERARKIACMNNLKGLFTATAGYLGTSNGVWPRIQYKVGDDVIYAKSWHDALHPHGIDWINLVCPTTQRKLGSPNVSLPTKHRMDYLCTFFDSRPGTAMRWPNQPWFAERADSHGGGNLVVMPNGSIMDMKEARRLATDAQGSP